MDSDNYCSGMRIHRETNIKEEKFVMRFPSASDAFYSLTCNQNDILYVKLTVLFLQCVSILYMSHKRTGEGGWLATLSTPWISPL